MERRWGIVLAALGLLAACGGGGGAGDAAADGAPDPGGADVALPDPAGDPGGADGGRDPGGPPDAPADAPQDGGQDPATADEGGDGGTGDPGDPGPQDPGEDGGAEDPGPRDPGAGDAADAGDPGDDGPPACPRAPAPADRDRPVVVSFPFPETSGKSPDWAMLRLSADGTLSGPGPRFQMGPAFAGEVAFTPDGQVGLAVLDDGTLGAFAVEPDGSARVIHASWKGPFYGDRVIMGATGDHAFVLDSEWRDAGGSTLRGGGVYRVDIACDGTLSDRGMVLPAKLPGALLPLPGRPDRAVLAARDALDVLAGGDVHLLAWGGAPAVLHSATMMGADAGLAGSAVTPDGKYVLVGDSGLFSTHGVAVVEVAGDTLVPRQFLEGLQNPEAIVVAPSGDTALVLGSYEPDDLWILDRDDENPTEPFSIRGKVQYAGGGSQLPTAMVMVDRGPLAGHVLVTEVEGVRHLVLGSDGSVTDRGVFGLGGGSTGMPAALGIAP